MRALNLHLGAVYAFLYLPIAVLMVLSLNRSGLPTAWGGFSLEWYGKLVENPKITGAALNSLIVALWSTLIATVLGTMLALGVARARPSPARDALLFAPMIIPDIVLAIALLSFFTLLKFSLGLHSIVMAHVVFNIAFVCAVVRARLASYDWSLNEASRDLGATAGRDLLADHLSAHPARGGRSALLAFTLSIDESSSPISPLARPVIDHAAHADLRDDPLRVTPEINAMATIVMAVSFVLVLAAQRLNRGSIPAHERSANKGEDGEKTMAKAVKKAAAKKPVPRKTAKKVIALFSGGGLRAGAELGRHRAGAGEIGSQGRVPFRPLASLTSTRATASRRIRESLRTAAAGGDGEILVDFINGHIPNFRKTPLEQVDNYVKDCWRHDRRDRQVGEKDLPGVLDKVKPDVVCVDNVILFPAIKRYAKKNRKPWVRIISCSENEIEDPDISAASVGPAPRTRKRMRPIASASTR